MTPARFFAAAHRKLALLAVMVLAALAFPLAEAWRRLDIELESTWAARRGLEPARLASQAQQALVVHRPMAAAVLGGSRTLEPERLRRQRLVDEQLVALDTALADRRLARAQTESDQLRHDWLVLLERIGERRLTPLASNLAHQLLIEQTFVIADLAAADSRLPGQTGRTIDGHAFALATRQLPRLALALQGPADAADAEPPPSAAAAAAEAARLARALAPLLQADAERAIDLDEWSALQALQSLLRATLPATSPPTATPGSEAAQALQQAALRASAAMLARFERDLAAAADALQAERRLVAAALALDLLLTLLAAALVMVRGPRRARPAAAEFDASTPAFAWDEAAGRPTVAESEAPASALLQRVRRPSRDPDTIGGDIGTR